MTIQNIVDRIKEISLNHKEIKSFYVGNTWDMSASKSSDIYPAVWVEFPVIVTYNSTNQKTYGFSLDVLALPKQDDVYDEMLKISECERIADQLLQVFKLKIAGIGIGKMVGLTVKNINSDIACGIRVDIEVLTNKECEPLNYFIENMDRL
jgi:hypothetical protein